MKYILLLLLFAVFLTGCAQSEVSSEQEVIKIGAVLPLTGFLSPYGEAEQIAIDYAVKKINENGGINGSLLQVIYEDGKCSGPDALTSAKKLIDIQQVKIILGGVCSTETLAIAQYAKEQGVIMFTTISSSPDVSNFSNVFRSTIRTDFQGEKLASFLIQNNYSKIAVITEQDVFSLSIREGLMFGLGTQKIVSDETFIPGTTDFRSYLTKIKAAQPDAIVFFALGGGTAGPLVNQIVAMGIEANLFTAEVGGASDFLEITGNNSLGIVYTDVPSISKNNSEFANLMRHYDNEGVAPIGEYFATARYETIQEVKLALESCQSDMTCAESLLQSQTFKGLKGIYSYDNNGDIQGVDIVLKQITADQPVIYDN